MSGGQKVNVEYKPQKADGSLDAGLHFKYDIKGNEIRKDDFARRGSPDAKEFWNSLAARVAFGRAREKSMPLEAAGYVTDVPYVWTFIPDLAPAWLDHVALVSGFAPPSRDQKFAWCDRGCGQGLTAAILAATHPDGRFFGIDFMATHIENARRLAAESGIENY